ncbi:DUF559 domain-containing protein [Leptolyngbya sp. 15MV]|nr:DUF559 domain-containing protein [Leptolyngbya sp. 15MV]
MTAKRLTPLAQRLRRNMTDAERRLWSRLRARQMGVHFTTQYQIGNAIADFACGRVVVVCPLWPLNPITEPRQSPWRTGRRSMTRTSAR